MANLNKQLEKLNLNITSFRKAFDPYCSEGLSFSNEDAITLLKKVIDNGIQIQAIIEEYSKYYFDIDKPHVNHDLKEGLYAILIHQLRQINKKEFEFYDDDKLENYELATLITALIKNKEDINDTLKSVLYGRLVKKRKEYTFKFEGLINPTSLNLKHDDHINPWSYWHANLNADILLIGQDFGDENYLKEHQGRDEENNKTNLDLARLFQQLGIDIGTPQNPNSTHKLFFTNAILGAKSGGMAKAVSDKMAIETAHLFTKPLVDLISPKVIITLGTKAMKNISSIYGLKLTSLSKAIDNVYYTLNNDILYFPVYHCSDLGKVNRNFDKQLEDWKNIANELNNRSVSVLR